MLYTGYVGFLGGFRLRLCGHARRAARSGLGQVDPALDYIRVDVPDHRHRARQLVGVLRTRVGRLVVLGSGGERLVHALARGHRADPLAERHREARHLQELDPAARDLRVLAEPGGHLPGALGRAGVGAFLRHRPEARPLHSRVPGRDHRRLAVAVCLARAEALRARGLRAVLARVLPAGQQCDPGQRRGPRAVGHVVARWSTRCWISARSRWARRCSP